MSRKVLICSPSVIWSEKTSNFHKGIPEVLKELKKQETSVLVVSNHGEPDWFKAIEDCCQYFPIRGRQGGGWVERFLEANASQDLIHSELVILGAKTEDMQMAVNSKSLLVRCEWSDDVAEMKQYGVGWDNPSTLPVLVKYLDDQVPWYFESTESAYKVFSLTNASTIGADIDTQAAAEWIRSVLKNGRSDSRNRLVLHMMSSIYKTDLFLEAEVFGYYPSSRSENTGAEVMSGFCRFVRENFGRKLKEPLFIRHRPAVSRHSKAGEREDATSQVESVHLNPKYKGKIKGKTVLVLDDYLTYGVSFGMANALLQAAGVKKVICVALGKFGNQAREYWSDTSGVAPYDPLSSLKFHSRKMQGTITPEAKLVMLEKFGPGS